MTNWSKTAFLAPNPERNPVDFKLGHYPPGIIQVGCKRFTFAEFQAASCEERTAYQVAEGYTPEQCAEYIRIVEFVIANGRPAEKEDESK